MPMTFQLGAELGEVVDLPVEDHPHGLFVVGHRLMAAGEVDNRQPTETETERAVDKKPLVIGAAMNELLRHVPEALARNRREALVVVLSADAAHISSRAKP